VKDPGTVETGAARRVQVVALSEKEVSRPRLRLRQRLAAGPDYHQCVLPAAKSAKEQCSLTTVKKKWAGLAVMLYS
jgi:hypothetical protein